jgi:hypothetical protein
LEIIENDCDWLALGNPARSRRLAGAKKFVGVLYERSSSDRGAGAAAASIFVDAAAGRSLFFAAI